MTTAITERKLSGFISNARLKLAKNQASAEQHTEAEYLRLQMWTFFITLSVKNNRTYWEIRKRTSESWDYTINHNENKDENEK